MKKIYVGNLSFDTTQEGLEAAFGQYGQVQSVAIIMDRDTGRSRGFAFVEMADDAAANAAINGLNGHEIDGRTLTVNEAKPREDRGGEAAAAEAGAAREADIAIEGGSGQRPVAANMNGPGREILAAKLSRVLEPEVMDSLQEAIDYDNMDHAEVNRRFVDDLLALGELRGELLDLGTGTAQIPVELCRRAEGVVVMAIDLAVHMLQMAGGNVEIAGLHGRVCLDRIDAKSLPYDDGRFAAVISNSIVHHIPDPAPVLAEAVRVVAPGGQLFVRDLARPDNESELERLVDLYAAGANDHQRQMFRDSLHAALTVAEVQAIVAPLGADPDTVQMTSDRHWTWTWTKPEA